MKINIKSIFRKGVEPQNDKPKKRSRHSFESKKTLVVVRSAWRIFKENKSLIISIAVVTSLLRAMFWYSLWGINILSFSNLQDIFIFTLEAFWGIIVLLFVYLIIRHMHIIWQILIMIPAAMILSTLYDMIFSLIITILLMPIIYYCLRGKLLQFFVIFILGQIVLMPIERYWTDIRNLNIQNNKERSDSNFAGRDAHYKQISFMYNYKYINTEKAVDYYFIGSNTQYFFIYEVKKDNVLIIPISECSDIKSTRLTWGKFKHMWRF